MLRQKLDIVGVKGDLLTSMIFCSTFELEKYLPKAHRFLTHLIFDSVMFYATNLNLTS